MNEQYLKLVNEIIPGTLVSELAFKTGIERKAVEKICVEVIARVLGDGSDLSKETLQNKVKNIVADQELKNLLVRLNSKYGIGTSDASKVLTELLPHMFKKINALKDIEEVDNKVLAKEDLSPQVTAKEEKKEEVVKPVTENKEKSVDDVFKNISAKASADNKKVTKKKKKGLFAKKQKTKKQVAPITADRATPIEGEITIVEKVCFIAIALALLALIATVIFLFLKAKY